MRSADTDEIPFVLREICDAMGADTAVLTMRPTDGSAAQILHIDADILPADLVRPLLSVEPPVADGGLSWSECASGRWTILTMRVDPVPGHACLYISAYFATLQDGQRLRAETVYRQRRPFAIGYFRLWQMDRIRSQRAVALEEALNLSGSGTILVDRECRIVFANAAAEAILEQRTGLRRHKNSVAAIRMSDSLRLRVAMDHIIGDNGRAGGVTKKSAPIMAIRRDDRPALILSVLPVDRRAVEPTDVAAILYIHDPSASSEKMMQPVCRLYDLTPAETRLASMLANGIALPDAARSMRVAEQTARGYLKQIFAKTNTHRQTDLIRLLILSLMHTDPSIDSEVI